MSEKERQATLESTFRDVATVVSDMSVNPDTRRPYPTTLIERALRDIHFSVKPTKTAKQQVLSYHNNDDDDDTVILIAIIYIFL